MCTRERHTGIEPDPEIEEQEEQGKCGAHREAKRVGVVVFGLERKSTLR